MTTEEIQQRVKASPALRGLTDRLETELFFRTTTSAQFDPLLIIAIISICIQVLNYCKARNTEELKQDIRDIRAIPPRKLMRLRRRINTAWRDCCKDMQLSSADRNPILTALYEIGETADDAALDELIALSRE
jgi:hypothetical protein